MGSLVCKCCESDVCLFQGDVGQRGPPGIPGDVSKNFKFFGRKCSTWHRSGGIIRLFFFFFLGGKCHP